jgi:NhaA family Na+:H+ antiporter
VTLDSEAGAALASPVALGIIAGLVLGKQIGVMLFAWLAVKLRLADLPTGATWVQLYGVSCLCGIGFTMSLFIGNLAFTSAETLDIAKMGILAGSVISGVLGWILLSRARPAPIRP